MNAKQIEAELQKRLEAEPRRDAESDKISARFGTARHLKHVPTVKCADGFKMSVQASAFHYCTPRDSEGPWSKVEVGFPSKRVEQFMTFIIDDSQDDPTDTVYGYVPLSTVAEVVAEHGGFAA
jgi:hypothetical protein